MKVESYVKSVLPTVAKDTVLDDLRSARGEIGNTVVPAYKQAAALMKNWKFKSTASEAVLDQFKSIAKTSGGNLIVVIDRELPLVLENVSTIEGFVDRIYGDDIAGAGLTYLKAQLLQYVEGIGFFADYARRVLNYLYVHETAEFTKEEDANYDGVQASLTPAETEYIRNNIASFATMFSTLTDSNPDLKKRLADVPDIVVTDDNAKTLPHTVGAAKLDPGRFAFIAAWLNPIFHVRLAIADYQVDRYKKAEAELAMLQMRKLNLEQLVEGTPNATLQRRLEETQTRVADLQYKLKKMEEAYA